MAAATFGIGRFSTASKVRFQQPEICGFLIACTKCSYCAGNWRALRCQPAI